MSIYDFASEDVVFTGVIDDMPEKYQTAEVQSIDNTVAGTKALTINVDTNDWGVPDG